MKRMLGFADNVEATLMQTTEAETLKAKLLDAEKRLEKTEAEKLAAELLAAEAHQECAAAEVKIAELEKSLAEAKAKVEEAANKANATIAAQGVPADLLPAAEPSKQAGKPSILAEFDAVTDPAKRTQFFRQHRAEILAAYRANKK